MRRMQAMSNVSAVSTTSNNGLQDRLRQLESLHSESSINDSSPDNKQQRPKAVSFF